MTNTDDSELPVNPRAAAYGEALRRLRRQGGISQADAARAAGLSQAAWTKYERGRTLAFLNLLNQDKCVQALGRTLADLEAARAAIEGDGAPFGASMDESRPAYGVQEEGSDFDHRPAAGGDTGTLTVTDDAMAPYAARGETVVYSLTKAPRAEQGVVLKRRDGPWLVRRFMLATASEIVCLRLEAIHAGGRTGWVEREDRHPVAAVEAIHPILWRGSDA